METVIRSYLEEYYQDLPAFLFGSRINGNSNGNSDWDVGVIGADKRRRIGNIEFIPIKCSDIEEKAIKFPFCREIFSFVKKIKPLVKENVVREYERKAKEYAINYTIQKSGKRNVSGYDVIKFYTKMNVNFNPFFRQKGLDFLKSEDFILFSSEDYNDILKDFKPSNNHIYRDMRKSDLVFQFITENFRDFKEAYFTPKKSLGTLKRKLI